MGKWIKNDSGGDKTWVGQLISDQAYYEIQADELTKWAHDSTLLTDIGSGDAVVAKDNSGSNDITDVSDGINYLKDIINPVDSDNAQLVRGKVAPTGWNYQHRSFEFETSKLSSFFEEEYDGSDPGFCTMTFLKDDGQGGLTACADQADADSNCIQTEVTWEPTFDIEMIGGDLRQLTTIATDMRLWIIAIPDLTPAQGGTKIFVNGVNLKFLDTSESVKVDGRASKRLPYNATYHTNKFKYIFKHDAGTKHKLMLSMEFFRP